MCVCVHLHMCVSDSVCVRVYRWLNECMCVRVSMHDCVHVSVINLVMHHTAGKAPLSGVVSQKQEFHDEMCSAAEWGHREGNNVAMHRYTTY